MHPTTRIPFEGNSSGLLSNFFSHQTSDLAPDLAFCPHKSALILASQWLSTPNQYKIEPEWGSNHGILLISTRNVCWLSCVLVHQTGFNVCTFELPVGLLHFHVCACTLHNIIHTKTQIRCDASLDQCKASGSRESCSDTSVCTIRLT